MPMTPEEAYAYLDERYHIDQMPEAEAEEMVARLVAMKHRPWCRTHMMAIAPNYGSECTCPEENDGR